MNHTAPIHTSITQDQKKKLLYYGNGTLNKGITVLLDIAEKKTITVNITTVVEVI